MVAILITNAAAWATGDFAGSASCLVCHNNMPAIASVHDEAFAASGKHLLPEGREVYRCEACHGPSIAHAQRQSGGPWQLPPVSFGGQDVSDGNAMCSACHADTMDGLGPHARSFHATAERNGLACIRCHGGVAHGLPDWVSDLRKMQEEERAP